MRGCTRRAGSGMRKEHGDEEDDGRGDSRGGTAAVMEPYGAGPAEWIPVPRLQIHRHDPREDWRADLARDVRVGLTTPPRELPPKYFYDERGSRLFEEITRLPEYYQTRTERAILESVAPALIEELGPGALVEFGSGSAAKTRVLLDAMRDAGTLCCYGPIDVSESALQASARRLVADYPELRVSAVHGDFGRPLPLPCEGEIRLVAFLGSTIGNLERDESVAFLERVGRGMTEDDGFLVGFDLVKDVRRLEAAYNDSAGVTARFNHNVLDVLNREMGANFEPAAFRHVALYNSRESRIEMYLETERAQTVRFAQLGLEIRLAAGERIRTELSYKYTCDSASSLLSAAGLRLAAWWTDPEDLFALALARRR